MCVDFSATQVLACYCSRSLLCIRRINIYNYNYGNDSLQRPGRYKWCWVCRIGLHQTNKAHLKPYLFCSILNVLFTFLSPTTTSPTTTTMRSVASRQTNNSSNLLHTSNTNYWKDIEDKAYMGLAITIVLLVIFVIIPAGVCFYCKHCGSPECNYDITCRYFTY